MGFALRRVDLRKNSQAKLDDAMILFQQGRYSNAYYLVGYSIEIGLKACIAAKVAAETIPDKYFINNVLKHDFPTLVGLAGLATELKEHKDRNSDFAANWALASEWAPDSRYESVDVTSAQAMITAITDPKAGVLTWIKTFW